MHPWSENWSTIKLSFKLTSLVEHVWPFIPLTWSFPDNHLYSDWSCWRGWCEAWNQVQNTQSSHCMGALLERKNKLNGVHYRENKTCESLTQSECLTVGNGAVQRYSSLIGPAAGHVSDGVASTSQHEHGQVKALHVLHTLCMTWETHKGLVRHKYQSL